MEESDDGQERGIRIKGWEIKSKHSGIATQEVILNYEQQLNTKHLPELLFSEAGIDIKHVQSKVHLSFTAFEALREWKGLNLPAIQALVAQDWQRTRMQDIRDLGVQKEDYDWTFTTPYAGHLYTDDGTVINQQQGCWRDTQVGIDRELLMRREPILFYDEFDLYESELDDHGMCKLVVKLRVMTSCWYALMRYWLRVDGVLVRCYDTRLFCAFNQEDPNAAQPPRPSRVVREVKRCECSLEHLARMGINAATSASIAAHGDPDKTAQYFESIAPSGMNFFKQQELVLQ
jgi:type 2A phosphatase activator TIP41